MPDPDPGAVEGLFGERPVRAYGEQLVRASQARELLDPDGLGGFSWLVQEVGGPVGWMDP